MEKADKRIKVKLSAESIVNEEVVKALDMLFSYSSTAEIKDTLVDLLLEYCLAQEDIPLNYKRNLECLYGLLQLLNTVEEEIRKKE